MFERKFHYTVELGCTLQEWTLGVRAWLPSDGLPEGANPGDVSLVGELLDASGELLKDRCGKPICVYGNTESALRFQVEEKLRRLFLQEPRPSRIDRLSS